MLPAPKGKAPPRRALIRARRPRSACLGEPEGSRGGAGGRYEGTYYMRSFLSWSVSPAFAIVGSGVFLSSIPLSSRQPPKAARVYASIGPTDLCVPDLCVSVFIM